ncbi:Protein kinase domain-containing protein 35 [Elsinoe fawcettii]|nr:Protein kinase domain-containing protein 35 [Elsinoe fawcettii]
MYTLSVTACISSFQSLRNDDPRVVACLYPKRPSIIAEIGQRCKESIPEEGLTPQKSISPIVLRFDLEYSNVLLGLDTSCDVRFDITTSQKELYKDSTWISLRHAQIWTGGPGDYLLISNTSNTNFEFVERSGLTAKLVEPRSALLVPHGIYDVSFGQSLEFLLVCGAETGLAQDQDRSTSVTTIIKSPEESSMHRPSTNDKIHSQACESITSGTTVKPVRQLRMIKIRWPKAHQSILATTGLSIITKKTSLGVVVAQKVPLGEGNDLGRERRVLLRLEHPLVIQMVTSFEEPTPPINALNLEYLHFPSLEDHLNREETVPPAVMNNVLHKAVEVLEYLFTQGVEHNDIKPSNIMADETNFRLIDFGLSLVGAGRRSTRSGTPHYVPPEVMIGMIEYGKRDIFALGVTLLRASRKVDLKGAWRMANVVDQDSGDASSMQKWLMEIARVASTLPKHQSWLARMVAQHPSDRPDAADLRTSLSKVKKRRRHVI